MPEEEQVPSAAAQVRHCAAIIVPGNAVIPALRKMEILCPSNASGHPVELRS